jgi:NADH-quinone oxidoreductase subunit M
MEFPFLSIITLSPIAAAIIILMMPVERKENARMMALAAMILGLVLSAYVYFSYNTALAQPGTPWADTLMFVEDYPWIPEY